MPESEEDILAGWLTELVPKCKTRDAAEALLLSVATALAKRNGLPLTKMLDGCRESVGYMTGYYKDHEEAIRIFDLFSTDHPIFGRKAPTPLEALQAGMEMGQASKRRTNPNSLRAAQVRTRERFLAGFFKYQPPPKDQAELDGWIKGWEEGYKESL